MNAIKYSPDDLRINVSVSKERNAIITSVQDYGIGIPKKQQKHIFKSFFQITDFRKHNPGVGLGLSIVKEITKAHNGKVWVKSNEGTKGSTFYFSLPVK